MARLAKLLFPLAVVTLGTQGEDPCKGMTVADCEISEDNIISRYKSHEITFFKLEIRLSYMRCFLVANLMFTRYNFNAVICERQCKKSDNCQFWQVYQNDTMEQPECIHLSTNYHQV